MFNLPEDILSRSRSTQIQWVIFTGLQALIFLFLLTAGLQFVFNYFGLAELSMNLVLINFIFTGVVLAIMYYFKFKKILNSIKTANELKNSNIIEDTLKGMEKKMLAELGADPKTTASRIVPILYDDKIKHIAVIVEVGEEVDKKTQYEIVDDILEEYFKGLVIEAKAEKKVKEK